MFTTFVFHCKNSLKKLNHLKDAKDDLIANSIPNQAFCDCKSYIVTRQNSLL